MLINVDLHGTLIDGSHDQWLQEKIQEGRPTEDHSSIWDDYSRMVFETRNSLTLNHRLFKLLYNLKEQGHAIRLWTNANYTLKRDIKHIINTYSSLFDSYVFCAGKKKNQRVEGLVIDNESVNLQCGEQSILVPTFNKM
ncbi:MAG: hypothetical protein EHM49_04335 [Deltaproteobacteria bacterium]|nr:MAG: hypothetical protein EHM49_04335 [Deltaproteobacteria bacterium]